jgi:hypothetical protein
MSCMHHQDTRSRITSWPRLHSEHASHDQNKRIETEDDKAMAASSSRIQTESEKLGTVGEKSDSFLHR